MDVGLVCDACSALTPIGVPQCKRCGAAVALDPRPRANKSRPPPQPVAVNGDTDGVPCSKCATWVEEGNKFCPNCGARVVAPQSSFDVETRVGPRPSGAQPVQKPQPAQ